MEDGGAQPTEGRRPSLQMLVEISATPVFRPPRLLQLNASLCLVMRSGLRGGDMRGVLRRYCVYAAIASLVAAARVTKNPAVRESARSHVALLRRLLLI